MRHEIHDAHLLHGPCAGDDLQGGPHGLHADEDVGGEVVVGVLHHEVARECSLVPDPLTGDQSQVPGDGAPPRVRLAGPGEEVDGVSYCHVPTQVHRTGGLLLQLRDLVDVDEGIVGLLVPLEDSGASVPSDNPNEEIDDEEGGTVMITNLYLVWVVKEASTCWRSEREVG